MWLGSLLFNVGMYAISTVLAIVGLPVLVLPRGAVIAWSRLWCRSVLGWLALTCGLRHRVIGREHLPAGPYILAVKHQSTWETLATNLAFPDCAFVLKRELMWIPVVGWMMWRAGNVGIDRAAGAKALRAILRDTRRALDGGRPVIIFPEGTRTPPGSTRPYQPGVAALYSQLKVPVVPVALNSGLFWGRRTFLKKPGTITMRILPPIEPGLPRAAFMDLLRERIEAATMDLIAEARLSLPQAVENAGDSANPS
ncbi:MAG: 1-acyl-sn-glycerol-3-phosphate acyltransferase [Alphaproteobacteria bacterium]|nr:1-acyl-sn-glycerol-3-phosphate acyltransferase [Alphaproteobacteria bacterium]MCW5743629.1 1-acyl-sn-glycerol-3-phosphate acyltransferase [Alphaproteobacteria bacterium]